MDNGKKKGIVVFAESITASAVTYEDVPSVSVSLWVKKEKRMTILLAKKDAAKLIARINDAMELVDMHEH